MLPLLMMELVTIANNAVTMDKLDDDGNFTDWTETGLLQQEL